MLGNQNGRDLGKGQSDDLPVVGLAATSNPMPMIPILANAAAIR
ncbi:hypothetical protein [Sphingobium sp. D43FB]|nr:hypothetical protein [Sphingobium sp. D43FB]